MLIQDNNQNQPKEIRIEDLLTFPVPLSVLRAIGQSLIYGEVQLSSGQANVYHPRITRSAIKVGLGYTSISGTPGVLYMFVEYDSSRQMHRLSIRSTSSSDNSTVFYCLIPA